MEISLETFKYGRGFNWRAIYTSNVLSTSECIYDSRKGPSSERREDIPPGAQDFHRTWTPANFQVCCLFLWLNVGGQKWATAHLRTILWPPWKNLEEMSRYSVWLSSLSLRLFSVYASVWLSKQFTWQSGLDCLSVRTFLRTDYTVCLSV